MPKILFIADDHSEDGVITKGLKLLLNDKFNDDVKSDWDKSIQNQQKKYCLFLELPSENDNTAEVLTKLDDISLLIEKKAHGEDHKTLDALRVKYGNVYSFDIKAALLNKPEYMNSHWRQNKMYDKIWNTIDDEDEVDTFIVIVGQAHLKAVEADDGQPWTPLQDKDYTFDDQEFDVKVYDGIE